MDNTDRIRRLRPSARLRRGRLDRRAGARLTRPLAALAAVLAAALAVLLPGAPAWAHNSLVEAQPAKEAKLTSSPAQVRLRFLQKLNPEVTTIVVTDAAKQKVPTDPPSVDGKIGSVALTDPLPNGTYTVAYQVVSTDGHAVKGSYAFTVADPSAVPSSAPAVVPSAAPAAAPDLVAAEPEPDDGRSGSVTGLVIGGVVLVGAVAFQIVRSRRRKG